MPYNLLTSLIPVFQLHYCFMKQVLTVLFFFLYYLYCLSIFQRTCCFRFKSGCKGKGFILNYQMFSEVFLVFLFHSFLRLSCERERSKRKKSSPVPCELDCKDKDFISYLPNFFGSFFVLIVSAHSRFFTKSFCQGFLLLESGCKSSPF